MNKTAYLIVSLLGFVILTGAACTTTGNTNVPLETTSTWQTYTSDYGFEIQYPQDWKVILEIDSKTVDYPVDAVLKVSFGTEARGESSEGASDGEWFVSVYNGDMPSKSIAGLITGTGTHFSDREEKTENITINGIPAIKALITTPSNPSWVYEAVLIEQEDRVFFITNGAIQNDLFDEFYNSFKRIDQTGAAEATASVDVITYEQFIASDTGVTFDVPSDVTVTDNLNGFPGVWKFIYDGNSYLVLYSAARGDSSPEWVSWTSRDENEITVTNHDNITVYLENGFANTTAYFLQPNPPANIGVRKQVGTALKGDYSSDLDEVYQRLVASVKLDGVAAF